MHCCVTHLLLAPNVRAGQTLCWVAPYDLSGMLLGIVLVLWFIELEVFQYLVFSKFVAPVRLFRLMVWPTNLNPPDLPPGEKPGILFALPPTESAPIHPWKCSQAFKFWRAACLIFSTQDRGLKCSTRWNLISGPHFHILPIFGSNKQLAYWRMIWFRAEGSKSPTALQWLTKWEREECTMLCIHIDQSVWYTCWLYITVNPQWH